MQTRKLATLQVSPIGMGTWKTFDVRSEAEIAIRKEIISACLSEGVAFLDSSPMYGESESVVGVTTEGKRDQFQLATKVWCTGLSQGRAEIARSFERFRTNYIDVFQIHNLLDWETHLATLEGLKAEGRIGLIGITHYLTESYPEMIRIMKNRRISTIQIPYNVLERTCEREILPLAAELGIGVIVMQPLGVGRLVTATQKGARSLATSSTWDRDMGAGIIGVDSRGYAGERSDSGDIKAGTDSRKCCGMRVAHTPKGVTDVY